MKHLGDIMNINGADALPVNVIIGGSPCQDYPEKTANPEVSQKSQN